MAADPRREEDEDADGSCSYRLPTTTTPPRRAGVDGTTDDGDARSPSSRTATTTTMTTTVNELLSCANRNHSMYGIPNLHPDFATAATVLRALRPRLLLCEDAHDDDDERGAFEKTKLYVKTGMTYEEASRRIDEFYHLLDGVEMSLLEDGARRTEREGEGDDVLDVCTVVVEGLDGSGKSTLVSNLCVALSSSSVVAIPTSTPPTSLAQIRPIMDCYGNPASRAFYVVSNYVLYHEMRERSLEEARSGGGVVLFVIDRFYTSTVAYTVGSFECESGSSVPDGALPWPNDLPKPNLVLRIDVDDAVRIGRMDERRQRERRERGCDEGGATAARSAAARGDTNPWDEILRRKLDLGRRILNVVDRVCSVNFIPLTVLDGSLPKNEVARVAADAVRHRLRIPSSSLGREGAAPPTKSDDDLVSGEPPLGDEHENNHSGASSPMLRMARFAEVMGLCRIRHAVGGDDVLALASGECGVSWFVQIATTTAMMGGRRQRHDAGAINPPRLLSVDVLSLDEAGIVFRHPATRKEGDDGWGERHDGAPASFAWAAADDGVVGDDDRRRFGRGERQVWGGEGVLCHVPDGLVTRGWLHPAQLLPGEGRKGDGGVHVGESDVEGGEEETVFRFIPHRCWVSIFGGGHGSADERRLEWNRQPGTFEWTLASSSPSSPPPRGRRRIPPSPGGSTSSSPTPPARGEEITLAILGPHTSGKKTVGTKVAQLLGWKFRDELGDVLRCRESRGTADRHQIGYDVERVPNDYTTTPAEQPPSAGTRRSGQCWDEVIFDEEATRDEEDAPISRVVETWHVGNLCWALQRRRHSEVSGAADAQSPYVSVDDDEDLRERWIDRTADLVESELRRKHVILVHLDVSAETMLRRRRSSSSSKAAELPFGTDRRSEAEEASRLQRALVGRAMELLEYEARLAKLNIPLLRVKNDEDGDEAVARTVRQICTYAEYHMAFVKSARAR